MKISYKQTLIFSALASSILLGSAFWFEIVAGLSPCKLCILQRWPHALLIMIAFIGIVYIKKNWILLLIVLSAITSGLIGFYHSGVEQGWWAGPSGCGIQSNSENNIHNLTTLLLETPVVKCNEIAWSLMGISMAGWNTIASFCITIFAFLSWKTFTDTQQ